MSSFFQEIPEGMDAALRSHGIEPATLRMFTSTDIDFDGRYHPQWLAVTDDRIVVFNGAAPHDVLLTMQLSEATEFRCQSTVGAGLLQARVGALSVDVLRYSNRLADRFEKVARKLDRAVHGEPICFRPEDEQNLRRCPTCGLMLESPGDSCPRCVSKGAVLARMCRILGPYRWGALLMLGCVLVGIGLDLVGPQLTRYLVDRVLPGTADAAQQLQANARLVREHLVMLAHVVAILASVQVLRMLINIVNGRLSARIGTAVTCDMRQRLVSHLEQLSVGFYDRQQVGALVGRVAYDTESLHGFVSQLAGGFLSQIIMVIGVGIMMFSLNPKLAMFTLIPAPLVITGSVIFWRYIYPRYYRFWDASSKQAGALSGLLSGIRVVKAMSQERREAARFEAVSTRLRDSRRNVDRGVASFNPVMGLVFQLGGWIVWFVGGRDVIGQEMTLGSLMAFFGYLWMFYGPLGTLTQFTNWLTQFATQAHRLFEILDTPVNIAEPTEPVHVTPVQGAIAFENVSFGYQRHNPVLHDLSLAIAPGEMVGVVGRSGSGKTTVVNLICRFYDVDEGAVKIDGVDVRNIPKEELHASVGVVLQEPFLFRGSMAENVTYGRPEATPDEVIVAAKAANAHGFVLHMTHGYDTWVGERGAGLSGGERQRVSIARVLLTDPRILILDEATSSIDAESEAAIQAALAQLVKGRTTIAIAHRLSTLRHADRIIVVDDGRIAEAGSHAALLAQNGLYARLLRIQGHMSVPSIESLREQQAQEQTERFEDSPLPDPRGHEPRWLTPELARVHLGTLKTLHVSVVNERIYGGVFAVRCFPVQHPRSYISLRFIDHDKRDVEVGLLHALDEWPAEVQALIGASLRRRYFVHTVQGINAIRSFSGYLSMDVETDLGPEQFVMRWQGDRAQDYGVSGKMLIDTEENRYLIPDVQALPARDRALFQRYIYW
jgi:ATP-binding cassette subfamily B protein